MTNYIDEAMNGAKSFIDFFLLFRTIEGNWISLDLHQKSTYKDFDEYVEVCLRQYFHVKLLSEGF